MHPLNGKTKREVTCCFTGHRPDTLPWGEDETALSAQACQEQIREKILLLVEDGYQYFISGMAQGIDLMAAEMVLTLQKEGVPIELCCAVPYRGQQENFPIKDKIRYHDILDVADEVLILEERYKKNCLLKRNEYMVDRSSALIAVYNQNRSGGTYYTVRYALKKGCALYMINPEILEEENYTFFR